MKKSHIWLAAFAIVMLALSVTFGVFDFYSAKIGNEVVNAVMKSESSSIQQGNLLLSLGKLQSTVETSENLAGLAVFDIKRDSELKYPLISLGELPAPGRSISVGESYIRTGAFDKVFLRTASKDKIILFSFKFKFIFWSHLVFSISIIGFASAIALLSRKFENARAAERAEVFAYVSKQIEHDIKSPLSALRIVSDIYRRRNQPIELLDSGVLRIEEVISDLRRRADSFKLLEDAVGNADLERFSVDGAAVSVIEEKRLAHPGRNIELVMDGRHEALGSLGDFKRAISNLLNNAIEASAPEQSVSVDISSADGQTLISIADRGQGIPKEIYKRLFERGQTFGKALGSGLGLYHARRVISVMRGTLDLKSEHGKGTVVTIRLPSPMA